MRPLHPSTTTCRRARAKEAEGADARDGDEESGKEAYGTRGLVYWRPTQQPA